MKKMFFIFNRLIILPLILLFSLLFAGCGNHATESTTTTDSSSQTTAKVTDPLPSWNEGSAKQAIMHFVHVTTDSADSSYVKPGERVATFDQDGTLWVEHPVYSQLMYCMDRVPDLVKAKPALKNAEPFKTVMSGDRAAIAKIVRIPTLKKLR